MPRTCAASCGGHLKRHRARHQDRALPSVHVGQESVERNAGSTCPVQSSQPSAALRAGCAGSVARTGVPRTTNTHGGWRTASSGIACRQFDSAQPHQTGWVYLNWVGSHARILTTNSSRQTWAGPEYNSGVICEGRQNELSFQSVFSIAVRQLGRIRRVGCGEKSGRRNTI
jgi:hypothetical protein